jgi:hypothetical protein
VYEEQKKSIEDDIHYEQLKHKLEYEDEKKRIVSVEISLIFMSLSDLF